jgi:hypothetical protein
MPYTMSCHGIIHLIVNYLNAIYPNLLWHQDTDIIGQQIKKKYQGQYIVYFYKEKIFLPN